MSTSGLEAHIAASDPTDAALAHAQFTAAVHSPESAERDPELVQIHAQAGQFYQACLRGSWVPDYLASRRLDAALLSSSPWKIGYAPPSRTLLTDHLRGLGHCDAALLCSGLAVNGSDRQLHDLFRDRLIIPLRADDGITVAFIGRRHPDASDDRGPKYLNSPDTDLYTKGHLLAGLAEARAVFARDAQPVLVEGPLDAIAVSISAPGRFAGVTPCGTALTVDQASALARSIDLRDRGLRIALDADPAGRKAAIRAWHHLSPLTANLTTVTFPDGTDPAGVLQHHGRQALHGILSAPARPLADLVVNAGLDDWSHGQELQFAEQQLSALRAAAQIIATMPAESVGPQAARLCATFAPRYGWPAEDVTREVIEAIERHHQAAPLGNQPATTTMIVKRAIAPSRSRICSSSLPAGISSVKGRHPAHQPTQLSAER